MKENEDLQTTEVETTNQSAPAPENISVRSRFGVNVTGVIIGIVFVLLGLIVVFYRHLPQITGQQALIALSGTMAVVFLVAAFRPQKSGETN